MAAHDVNAPERGGAHNLIGASERADKRSRFWASQGPSSNLSVKGVALDGDPGAERSKEVLADLMARSGSKAADVVAAPAMDAADAAVQMMSDGAAGFVDEDGIRLKMATGGTKAQEAGAAGAVAGAVVSHLLHKHDYTASVDTAGTSFARAKGLAEKGAEHLSSNAEAMGKAKTGRLSMRDAARSVEGANDAKEAAKALQSDIKGGTLPKATVTRNHGLRQKMAKGTEALNKVRDVADKGFEQGHDDGNNTEVVDVAAKSAKKAVNKALRKHRAKKQAEKAVKNEANETVQKLLEQSRQMRDQTAGKAVDVASRAANGASKKAAQTAAKDVTKKAASETAKNTAHEQAKRATAKKAQEIQKGLRSGKVVEGMSAVQRNQAAAKAAAAAGSKVAGSLGALLGGGGGGLMLLLTGVFLVFVLLVGITAADETEREPADIGEVENQLVVSMRELGFSDVSIAAVLGNLVNESGMDPTSDVVMDGQFYYAYERALGLFQYTHAFDTRVPSAGCPCEYCQFKVWCSANSLDPYSVDAQVQWTFGGSGQGNWSSRYTTNLCRSLYYSNCDGWQSRFGSSYYGDATAFRNADDIELAAYCWMAAYEKPANGSTAHLQARIDSARSYLAALQSGSIGGGSLPDEANTSAKGLAIKTAAYTVGSPGAGWCAKWVSMVYQAAGYGYPSGNACDMARSLPYSTADLSHLEPGMVIAVTSHPHTSAGATYGHVGIYVGNGMVRHNIGSISEQPLVEWIAYYGATNTPRYGNLG